MAKKILLGITGSIAAYKAAELVRLLVEAGFEVKVVLTQHAEAFITPLTLQALSRNKVHTALLDEDAEAAMSHIELARWADVLLVAPASAHFIAQLANGLCPDLLNTLCLATCAHIIIAPAMNQHMWAHPAVQDNVSKLKQRGTFFLGPDSGVQACGDIGLGRMIAPEAILQHLMSSQANPILAGLNVLITAGCTQEPIDPVRFITNKSSGKMGYALAEEAIKLGAKVTLISGHAALSPPHRCEKIIKVNTAHDMLRAVEIEVKKNDIFIASAAVGDYKVLYPATQKIKRQQALTLTLEPNIDILAKILDENKIFSVGFAAETENLLANARDKLLKKKVDIMVANDVSRKDIGFDSDYNEVYLLTKDNEKKLDRDTKNHIAKSILQYIHECYN